MNEQPKNFEGEEQYSRGVKEALDSGRLGFNEISVMATEELFEKAPEEQTFTVPGHQYVTTYTARAGALNRKDIKFEVENEK